jgi:ribokinase
MNAPAGPLDVAACATPVFDDEAQARLRRAARERRVVVSGSLNLDHLLEVEGDPDDDGTVLVLRETWHPGGHAGNCAAALARLGVDVALVAAVGRDRDGDALVEDLESSRVDISGVRRIEGVPTGRVTIPLFGMRHFMLMARGANDGLNAPDVHAALERGADAVIAFDPAPAALLAIGERLSWVEDAPRLYWTPGGLYARGALLDALLPACATVFFNRAEFALARARLDLGRDAAGRRETVVTLGAGGAVLLEPAGPLKVAAPSAACVDPTGAGDAFCAAYVLASLAELPPATRLLVANVAGAHAVTRTGARGGHLDLDGLVEACGRASSLAATTDLRIETSEECK